MLVCSLFWWQTITKRGPESQLRPGRVVARTEKWGDRWHAEGREGGRPRIERELTQGKLLVNQRLYSSVLYYFNLNLQVLEHARNLILEHARNQTISSAASFRNTPGTRPYHRLLGQAPHCSWQCPPSRIMLCQYFCIIYPAFVE